MKRLVFLLVCLSAIGIAQKIGPPPGLIGGVPGPQQGPPRGAPLVGPIPASLFGMNLVTSLPGGPATQWPTVPVGALGKGSFMTWPYLEPSAGTFDWRTLDAQVALAQAHGVPFTLALEGAPGWAVSDQSTCSTAYGYTRCTGMPDLTALDAFMTALVTRYRGRIEAYELYNEPDIPGPGNGFVGTMAQFVTLTAHEAATIRALDPAARVGSPSGMAPFMAAYYAAGGVVPDVLDFHLYPDPSLYTTPKYPAAEGIVRWTASLRAVWAARGFSQQPIWETEGSWNHAVGSMADPDQQAAFVARWYLLHWSTGVSRGYWYAWNSDTFGVLGTQAQAAWTQVQQWMVGATMPAPCETYGESVVDHSEPELYACTLTRPGGYQALAIWDTNGSTSYTPDYAIYTRYRDLTGATTPIAGVITISYQPILLEHAAAPSRPVLLERSPS